MKYFSRFTACVIASVAFLVALVLFPAHARGNADDIAEAHYQKIYQAHPDADQIYESRDFTDWLVYQHESYRHALHSGTADEVISVFDEYKKYSSTTSSGGVFRCTHPETGAITLSDAPCSTGRVERIPVPDGNVLESRHLYNELGRREAQVREQERQRWEQEQQHAAYRQQRENERRQRDAEKACREAVRPYKGAQGGALTAAQLNFFSSCINGGRSSPSHQDDPQRQYSVPTPAPAPPQPSTITSCDNAGCWDNLGNRYNRGAGQTYIQGNGRVCHAAGSQMHCP